MVVAMTVLIFLVGALLGGIVGVFICIRYVRQELTANISPTLQVLQLQLDNLQSSVQLALAVWHTELHRHTTGQDVTLTVGRDGADIGR